MKATLAQGCGQGSLRKVSVGVLLPVCKTYKSSQKVGWGGSYSVRLGLGERGKLSEGFPDPQTDIQANAGFPQETETRTRKTQNHRVQD